ncbi:hypothetical protein [Cryobacterium zhongshanensis]|jgi:hypothetical protein|uniref:Uncharacterized protein n=1 Tax=Cryobacterium zhongshanensis TaxID=2928153 RepID=A0AA41UGG3_9MICO|nr:hypothetical protein [Cryobacterium zhongshanensis]MCI4659708.1 hypothetical protein [Cryobacterium zhongshanensis]
MSQDDRDQRGGHRRRRSGTKSCGCCPVLAPRAQSINRTERNRVAAEYESLAEGRVPKH